MNFDPIYFLEIFPELLPYVPLTVVMAVLSLVAAIIGGLILALILRAKIPVLYRVAVFYISFFRAVPTLVQLFLIYYGLPQLFPELRAMEALTAAIIGLSIKNAAYMAEIFRAALDSVDKGQLEACKTVGMTSAQAYRRIILPQAARNAIPATGNTFIGLLKETSLAFTLGLTELFAQGKILASASYKYLETYLAVAIMYWLLTIIYSLIQRLVEGRLNKPYKS
ncbi:amino acid ABC transporter permease [Terribacillus saccharophilus]|uniref:amino acid ABC transporter permease n=1 Tax=Terribacillus saccharophilus TaxID=361277 RepID=UPI003982B576